LVDTLSFGRVRGAPIFCFFSDVFLAITLDGSVYLSPKQRLNLTCNASGTTRAPEFIDWFHNGNLIDERKSQWRNRAVITSYRPEVPGRQSLFWT
jgi:hypothetical protein